MLTCPPTFISISPPSIFPLAFKLTVPANASGTPFGPKPFSKKAYFPVRTPTEKEREKLKLSVFDTSATEIAVIVGALFGAAGKAAGGV